MPREPRGTSQHGVLPNVSVLSGLQWTVPHRALSSCPWDMGQLSRSIDVENCAGLNKAALTLLLPGYAKEVSRGHGQNNIAQPTRKSSRTGERAKSRSEAGGVSDWH